jgi:hypothetical protein
VSLIADLNAPLPAAEISLLELIMLGRIDRAGGRTLWGQCWSENQLGRRGMVVFRHFKRSPLIDVEITLAGKEMLTRKRNEWRAAREDPAAQSQEPSR